jgi:glycosyltransferase involved in cell wall biosynthesis
MVLVSVVIPIYNGEKTIEKTINSVISQTHQELELIIVNDGSEDTSLEVINSIYDPRINVFSYQNSGVSKSRNRGIEKSTGEFITFLDADDLWTSDKLELQIQALQSNPNAGLAYSWVDYINSFEKITRPGSRINASGDVLEKLILRYFLDNGSNALIPRKILEKIGYFDESLTYGEDWELCLRIAKQYSFVCVPKVQILYRQVPGSSSSNTIKSSQEIFFVLDKFFLENPNIRGEIVRKAYADKYRYLSLKSMDGLPSKKNTVFASCLFIKSFLIEPSWWTKRMKLFVVVILKILVNLLIPMQFINHITKQRDED